MTFGVPQRLLRSGDKRAHASREASSVKRERVSLGCVLRDLVLPELFVPGLLHGGREHKLHVFIGHGVSLFRGAAGNKD